MSPSPAAPQPGSTTHDPEEVIRLACPECSGKLNLRRKHVGIAGACVHCRIPVMAVDEGGSVNLIDTRVETPTDSAEKPRTEEVEQPESSEPVVPVADNAASENSAPVPDSSPGAEPIAASPPSEPSPAPASIPAQDFGGLAPEESEETPAEAPVSSGSTWGFPDREETPSEEANPPSTSSVAPEVEEKPEPEPAATEEPSTFDFSSLAKGTPPPWEDILSGSKPEKNSSETVEPSNSEIEREPEDNHTLEMEPAIASDPKMKPVETALEISEEEPVSTEEKEEELSTPFPKDDPFEYNSMPGTSALFSSKKEEVGVNSGWGTKVPSQNHASISPFSTGSASPEPASDAAPGFAESLFQEKPASKGSKATMEAKSPFGESSANDSGSAPASPFAQIGNPSSDEEVVLDGDGRPMAPMTDEEKDAFAREMMQLGDYHKRSPWVKRIRRFFITIAVLVGGAYAAYLFMPREIVKEYKNKALAFLEPGSVLLDFLPVEIVDDPEGEEGDKMVKVKAIDGLNQLTDQMDGYLNQADQNLRESGATVEEREKLDKMDQPNMKLPFNVDLDKLQNQVNDSAESAQAELDKQL